MTANTAFFQIMILAIFTAIYLLLYRNSRFYLANRIYLLLTTLLALVMPFISLDVFPKVVSYTIRRSSSNFEAVQSPIINSLAPTMNPLLVIYWSGVVLGFGLLSLQLLRVYRMINHSNVRVIKGSHILLSSLTTSSFFHYIFLSGQDEIKENHEIGHSVKVHSLDRLIMSILICFMWCNPFVYIARMLMIENHEYEADEYAINILKIKRSQYGERLLQEARILHNPLLISNQFYSFTKNRIAMLGTNRPIKKIAYILMLPLIIAVFGAFTFKEYNVLVHSNKDLNTIDTLPGSLILVDTIAVFDYDTKTEEIKVVKSDISLDKYLSDLDFSGEFKVVIDTFIVFNVNTNGEYVEVSKKVLPIEVYNILPLLSEEQIMAVYDKYSSDNSVADNPQKLNDSSAKVFITDTVMVFDNDTKTERVLEVRNEVDLDDYLTNLKFSGKVSSSIDTILVFDYDTFEESITILQTNLPSEIVWIYDQLDMDQTNELNKVYAERVTKSFSGKGDGGVIFLGRNPNGKTYEVKNLSTGETRKVTVHEGMESITLTDIMPGIGNFEMTDIETGEVIKLNVYK